MGDGHATPAAFSTRVRSRPRRSSSGHSIVVAAASAPNPNTIGSALPDPAGPILEIGTQFGAVSAYRGSGVAPGRVVGVVPTEVGVVDSNVVCDEPPIQHAPPLFEPPPMNKVVGVVALVTVVGVPAVVVVGFGWDVVVVVAAPPSGAMESMTPDA